jgi:hypothetical protein
VHPVRPHTVKAANSTKSVRFILAISSAALSSAAGCTPACGSLAIQIPPQAATLATISFNVA